VWRTCDKERRIGRDDGHHHRRIRRRRLVRALEHLRSTPPHITPQNRSSSVSSSPSPSSTTTSSSPSPRSSQEHLESQLRMPSPSPPARPRPRRPVRRHGRRQRRAPTSSTRTKNLRPPSGQEKRSRPGGGPAPQPRYTSTPSSRVPRTGLRTPLHSLWPRPLARPTTPLHLRRLGLGKNPPPSRHRPLRLHLRPQPQGPIRQFRGVHERISSTRSVTTARRPSRSTTETSTCSSSTTSSSLQGKEQTLEEFFHTFNALHNAGKHVVISRTSPPAAWPGSREAHEDQVRVGSHDGCPGARSRDSYRILRKKAAGMPFRRRQVLEYIASKHSPANIAIGGCVIRVTASGLNKQPIDLSLAQVVLKD